MFKNIVYIEKAILKSHATENILNKINPEEVLLINDYKEILNQTNSHWLFNKHYQKIILAKRESEFYYEGAYLTSSLGYECFYYNTLALNCLFHCEYCYLQGMYNTPHLVMFLNNYDFIKATKQLIKRTKKKIYMALSYDTDLLAIERYYPYCKEWMEFASQENNITIEIRTKSHQLDLISDAKISDNVILSFTLSPEYIQKTYEPFTPGLEQRLKAVKQAINKGYKVMLCFDPLIDNKQFKEIYLSFFEKIFSEIHPNSVNSISIGTFRMNNDFLKRIRKNGNTSDIYYYQYEIKNKTATYPQTIKKEMIMFVKKELLKRTIKDIHIYE